MIYPQTASAVLTDRKKTVCFTGHRPEKLPFSMDDTVRLNMLRSMIYLRIDEAYRSGYRIFLTGMARGVDMWAALGVMALKKQHNDIRLVGVSPYKNEYCRLRGTDKWDYGVIEEAADDMIYISQDYFKGCYQKRNNFIVNNSSLIIGVVYNMKSGTGKTLAYAEKMGLKADVIDLNRLPVFLTL